MKPTKHPLSWPEGWPRSPHTRRSKFDRERSMLRAFDDVLSEVHKINDAGTDTVLSCNVPRGEKSGKPVSGQRQPADVGVAVYFTRKGKQLVLACDRWDRVECNAYAIAKHIEALRGQERWGVGSVDQALAGYLALPAIGGTHRLPWREVLNLPGPVSKATLRFHVAELIRTEPEARHADITLAFTDAKKELDDAG